MVSITHRRGTGRTSARALAIADDPTDGELRLTAGQQEYLTVHGFGPQARADFTDPEVRKYFVQLLRECGVLAPATAPSSRTLAARPRHHLRRVG